MYSPCRLLLAVFLGTLSLTAFADEPKPVQTTPAQPVITATPALVVRSQSAARNDEKKAEDAQKAQEALIAKAQLEYEQQLKKAQEAAEKAASHKLLKEVKLTGKNGNSLQTLAVDPNGRVLALIAQPRGFSQNQKNATSEIHVLDPDGKAIGVWTVKFHANALNAGPDGTVYVAGDGKLAKFDSNGKMLGEVVELPFIADMLKDKDKLKDKAEKQIKSQKDSFERMVKQYRDRATKLEEKQKAAKAKGEELTKSEQTQLKQHEQVLNSLKETEKYYNAMTVETVLSGMLGRVKVINSVSVNDKDVYIVCGENEGYGFGLWRMDHNLKNAKKITSNMTGCCGQMDVQCCGDDIVVAENTKHRFARYDRDGKELSAGGKRGQETDLSAFGGCCNPMNVKECGGDILTAESEGLIKRFGPSGEFKGVIGSVKISGGCKNVAIGANTDASRVYFCDQPGGRVFILAKKESSTK